MKNPKRHILFIDAYDSFTNNVVGLLEATLGVHVTVIHHDSPLVVTKSLPLLVSNFDAVVIGPGPGHPAKPEDIGLISQLWKLDEQDLLPIFGVCLGFQSLSLAYGGAIERLARPRHGIVTKVSHKNTDIFTGIAGDFYATNYHSLRVRLPPASAGSPLVPLAWDLDDSVNGDILLAVRHSTKPFWGVQFHPESECTTAAAAQLMMANWWAQANAWMKLRNRSRPRDADYIIRLLAGPSLDSDTVQIVPEDLEQNNTNHHHQSGASVLPILCWKKLPATGITSTDLYEALRDAGHETILLDSQDHPRGRFSILGLSDTHTSPRLIYQVAEGVLRYYHGTGAPGSDKNGSSPVTDTRLLSNIDQVWPLLQQALDQNKPRQVDILPDDVPFWGGWMGYISYEAGLETIHVSLDPTCASQSAADVNMVFIHRSIVLDHKSSTAVVQTLLPSDEDWLSNISAMIQQTAQQKQNELKIPNGHHDSALERHLAHSRVIKPDQFEYCAKVAACQDVLAAGDSYELCLTDESHITCPEAPALDPWRLYKKLRRRNTAPFGAFVSLPPLPHPLPADSKSANGASNAAGAVTILSSSPERFLHWSRPPGPHTHTDPHSHNAPSSKVEFRPIKGTVRKSPTTTRRDAEAILHSPKERAENLMIVDLIRHDLGGVVGARNVRVSQLMVMEEYETVYQLVSAIEGDLVAPLQTQGRVRGDKKTGMDVLKVSLPPGSMTGAPKKRSCEVLRDLEKRRRGVYAGVLGYMDVGGGGDFSVVIRTAFRESHRGGGKGGVNEGGGDCVWRVGAGGAVTIQSDVLAEFHEMETKAESVLGTMELEVISYERLKARHSDEVNKMIHALSTKGMFFLDMQGPSSEQFLADLPPVLEHQRRFFERPNEIKNKFYTFDSGVEKIHLGREEHVTGMLDLPQDLHPVADKVASTSTFIDALLRELGTILCTSMDPPVPAVLDQPDKPGLSNLYLAISKAKRGTFIMTTHTDDGFLTLTFYNEPFNEVLDRETNEWKRVDVNRHMPIVNVGDQLQKNSGDKLYSPIHRCYQDENEIDLIMFDLFESPRAKEGD
ncbi:para-aminobenzoate synthase [Coniochaeta ligniaria NRRL 30616]|uniref:aminodeoxychorismate synthase n=1 Tax=Coniochaeta ligniaria NRRL 30616 TaxID=1408157 RepID=A0A1J7IPC0_9PEZI|nr:para-aminobenzoate synthase [Coniochaeta ligniaria NRRL 30616]